MKTKIGTTFGLALLLAMGVIATMLALGMFSPQKAQANHVSTAVSAVTFTPSSLNVNAAASWNVTFGTSGALVAGSGTVTIAFPSGTVVPATIDKSRIAVGPSTNQIPLTSDPTISGTTVTLTVPATDPDGSALNNPIAANDTVTVFFSQLAGIKNTKSSGTAGSTTAGTAGKVKTSGQTTNENIGTALSFATTISLSKTSAAEGDAVTVTVGGFTSGLKVSLSGSPKAISGSATVGSDGTAAIAGTMKGVSGTVVATDTAATPKTASASLISGTAFAITVKPTLTATASGKAQDTITLKGTNYTVGETVLTAEINFGGAAIAAANVVTTMPGGGIVLSDKDVDGVFDDFTIKIKIPSNATTGVNQIQVTDGTATAKTTTEVTSRSVTLVPSSGPPGTVVTIGGTGFPESIATSANNTISISPVFGSTAVTGLFTGGAGDLSGSDTFTIPASATAVDITVTVSIRGGDTTSATGSSKFTVETRGLTVSPDTGPRGTKILVSGDKFTANGTVAANGISVGSVSTVHVPVTLDSTGSIPGTSVTVPATAPLGKQTVALTDSGALAGSGSFTITQPTISLSPTSSTMGNDVTITGAGWVPSTSVTVTMNSGGVAVGTAVEKTDGSGNLTVIMEVPSTAGVGLAVASFTATDGTAVGNTALARTLTIAAPKITLSAASAVVGDSVSLDATGFLPSSGMSDLTIGGADVKEGVVTSDTEGKLTTSFVVPGLSGAQLVSITIGGTTITTSLTVTAAPEVPAAPETTETVFEAEIAAESLVRVWYYSNADQEWSFFDPAFIAAEANTYTSASSGDIVWINITADTTFQDKSLTAGWNLIALD